MGLFAGASTLVGAFGVGGSERETQIQRSANRIGNPMMFDENGSRAQTILLIPRSSLRVNLPASLNQTTICPQTCATLERIP